MSVGEPLQAATPGLGRRATVPWRGAAAGLLIALVGAGCAGSEESVGEEQVAFEVLAQGQQPAADVGPNAVGVRIIESADDFERAYEALVGKAAPSIDFQRSVVLALDMGRQPTGGYALEVESVVRTGDTLTARVVAIEPGPQCVTTQVVSRPYQLVRIPVDDEPIDVERRTVQRDCG